MLSREEVERRLEAVRAKNPHNALDYEYMVAIQTAQSLYSERDAQTERHKAEILTCLRAMDKLEAERDALAAEVKRLEAVAEAARAVVDFGDNAFEPDVVLRDALAALDRGQG